MAGAVPLAFPSPVSVEVARIVVHCPGSSRRHSVRLSLVALDMERIRVRNLSDEGVAVWQVLKFQDIGAYVSKEALCRFTHLANRPMRQGVQDCRDAGIPIESSTAHPGGYRISPDIESVGKAVEDMRSRGRSLFRTANAMEKGAPEFLHLTPPKLFDTDSLRRRR